MSKWERIGLLCFLWGLSLVGVVPIVVENFSRVLQGKGDVSNIFVGLLGFAVSYIPVLIGKKTARKPDSGGDNENKQ